VGSVGLFVGVGGFWVFWVGVCGLGELGWVRGLCGLVWRFSVLILRGGLLLLCRGYLVARKADD